VAPVAPVAPEGHNVVGLFKVTESVAGEQPIILTTSKTYVPLGKSVNTKGDVGDVVFPLLGPVQVKAYISTPLGPPEKLSSIWPVGTSLQEGLVRVAVSEISTGVVMTPELAVTEHSSFSVLASTVVTLLSTLHIPSSASVRV
jgi:hypothetical protein